jgi:SSS family solute:Na+ symporter
LLFLGFVGVLAGGPADDSVLLWLVDRLEGAPAHPWLFAFVAFAVLAASMSTGDALLHAGGSILVRDVLLSIEGHPIGGALVRALRRASLAGKTIDVPLRQDDAGQTRVIRVTIVLLLVVSFVVLESAGGTSIVDLLLLAYAMPIQFLPIVLLGLYWRRANRVGAEVGLSAGLITVVGLFLLRSFAPTLAATLNPLDLEIGLIGLVVNLLAMVSFSLAGPRPSDELLRRFES